MNNQSRIVPSAPNRGRVSFREREPNGSSLARFVHWLGRVLTPRRDRRRVLDGAIRIDAGEAGFPNETGGDQNRVGTVRIASALAKRAFAKALAPYRLETRRGLKIAAPSEDEAVFALVDSQTFAVAAEALALAKIKTAVWFRGSEPRWPYELRRELRRAAFLAASDDPSQVHRLDLLGVPAILAPSPIVAARLALRRAEEIGGPVDAPSPKPMNIGPAIIGNALPDSARGTPPILFQVDHFLQGGLEQVVLDLGKGLSQRGFEIELLILGDQGRAADQARELGLKVSTLPDGTVADREASYRRLLQDRGIRLVKAQYSLFGAGIAAELGIPFVQVIQNCYVWLDDLQIKRYRHADAFTACTVCVSPESASYSELKLGLNVEKMAVIPNGASVARTEASPERRRQTREEIGASPDDFLFLNVASVYPPKAQFHLVNAFARIASSNPRARLAFLGGEFDAAYARRVRERIGKLGLTDRVRMLGHRDDISRFYAAADAFVLPSCWEGWSVALNEAIAAGLPVVATDVGSARDLLDPNVHVLVPTAFQSICDLDIHNYGRWIESKWSRVVPDLARGMQKVMNESGGRRRASSSIVEFERTADRMSEDYATLFHALIQGAKPSDVRSKIQS